MRHFVLAFLLLLSACNKANEHAAPAIEENDRDTVTILSGVIVTQSFRIASTPVTVTRALVGTSDNNDLALYLIKTPHQTLSFGIDTVSHILILNLSSNYKKYLNESFKESKIEDINYEFYEHAAGIAVMNVLNVSRCVTAGVYKEIVAVLKKPRHMIYFSVDTDTSNLTNLALTYNLETKSFQLSQDIPDGSRLRVASRKNTDYILKPNTNVLDRNYNLKEDNVYIAAHELAEKCDALYELSYRVKSWTVFNNVSDRYLPKYDSNIDEENSKILRLKIADFQKAFINPLTIAEDDESKYLTPELILSAKENPLYKTFLKGFVNE